MTNDCHSIIELNKALCDKIRAIAMQPHISKGDAYRLQSLVCDISSASNVAAAIVVDSEKIFDMEAISNG